jgi:coenzyme PQQ synthesis protein D (PqqD)
MSDPVRLRPDDVEWREVEGEVVVLDLRDSTYFAVNETGAAIWPELARGTTREQLVARLVDRFAVDEATASKDLEAFLSALGERGLLAD